MRRTTIAAVICTMSLGAAGQAWAQVADLPSFEFQGETTTRTVENLTGRSCTLPSRRADFGVTQCPVTSFAAIADAEVRVGYFENRMVYVSGVIPQEDFQRALLALTSRYGEPSVESKTMRDSLGVRYRTEVATWQFADGTLTLNRNAHGGGKTHMNFQSRAWTPTLTGSAGTL